MERINAKSQIAIVSWTTSTPYEIVFYIDGKRYTFGLNEYRQRIALQIAKFSVGKALAYVKKHCNYVIKGSKKGGKMRVANKILAIMRKTSVLKKKYNKNTGREEWALVSRSKPERVLKWFGPNKPSKEQVAKEERRIQYFKHRKGSSEVLLRNIESEEEAKLYVEFNPRYKGGKVVPDDLNPGKFAIIREETPEQGTMFDNEETATEDRKVAGEKTKWYGSLTCDFCKADVTKKGKRFYDAKTIFGPWALMCEECYHEFGVGKLGIGYGQAYDSKTLEKVEG